MGLGHFFKWPPWKSNFGNISTFKWQKIIILLSDTYVSRLKKSNETTLNNIGSFLYGEFGKSQDGNWWKSFYAKIWMFILETKFVYMVKCYSKEDRYGYNG